MYINKKTGGSTLENQSRNNGIGKKAEKKERRPLQGQYHREQITS